MKFRDQVDIIIAPVPTEDPYGNESRDWSTATEAPSPASVQAPSSDEDNVAQDRTETRWRLYVPPGTALTAEDRVRWQGDTYEVVGEPTGGGRYGYVKAALRKVER